jgi:hypothetical protein
MSVLLALGPRLAVMCCSLVMLFAEVQSWANSND